MREVALREGPLVAARFSLDGSILAIQRTSTDLEFLHVRRGCVQSGPFSIPMDSLFPEYIQFVTVPRELLRMGRLRALFQNHSRGLICGF